MIGEFEKVFDATEAHREEQFAVPTECFVNVHQVIR